MASTGRQVSSVCISVVLLLGAAYLAAERGDDARAYGVTVETLDSGGEALTAARTAPTTIPPVDAHELRVDGELVEAPSVLQGAIGTITFARSPTAGEPVDMTFGRERIPLPPGASVTIEDAVGAADLAPAGGLTGFAFTGTARKVVVETVPGTPMSLTAGNDAPGVPAQAIIIDGQPTEEPGPLVGSFDQIIVVPASHPTSIEFVWGVEELQVEAGLDTRDPTGDGDGDGEPFELNAAPVIVINGAYVAINITHHDGQVFVTIEGLVDYVLFPDITELRTTIGSGGFDAGTGHSFRDDLRLGDETVHDVGAILTERGINTAPVADFEYEPDNPFTNSPMTFKDLSTDEEERVAAWVEWTFCDGTTSTERNPIWTPTSGGSCTVTLVATDSLGAQDSTSATFHVTGSPPVVNIEQSPDPANIIEPTTFYSNAVDPDGTEVTVTWQFHDGTTTGGLNATFQYTTKGTHSLTVTAVDEDGQSTTETLDVVVANIGPEADAQVSPESPATNETVTLTDASSDPDAPTQPGIVDRTWMVDTFAARTGTVEQYTFARPGQYTVSLTVQDADGATDTDTFELDIANRPPTLAIDAPSTVNVTEAVELTADYHDPDAPSGFHGSPPSGFAWTANGNAIGDDSGTVEVSFDEGGLYHIVVEATDADGATVRGHFNMTVAAPPNVMFEADPGTVVDSGTTITFTDTSEDPDPNGEVVSRLWEWSHDGLTSTAQVHSRTIEVPGDYELVLTVTDDLGVSASLPIPITILNRDPVVHISPDPGVVNPGDQVTFTASATDPDNNVTQITWLLDGDVIATGPSTDITFSSGTHTVTARATDELGGTGQDTVQVEVNQPPEVRIVGVPGQVTIGTEVQFDVTIEHPDGDETSSVQWEFGDGGSAAGSSVTHTYGLAGTYTVWANVTDDRGGVGHDTLTVRVVPPPFNVGISVNPTAGIQTGTSVNFGLDLPAGHSLASATWSFGDGPPQTTSSTSISHTFTTSGQLAVEVHATSHTGATDTARTTVDVVSSTAITVAMEVHLPDGKLLNVTNPGLDFELSVPRAGLVASTQPGSGTITVLGNGVVQATIDGGLWAAGDVATLEVTKDGLSTEGEYAMVHASSMMAQVQLHDAPTVLTGIDLGCTEEQTRTVAGDCVYDSLQGPIEALVSVEWWEGTPAGGVELDLRVSERHPTRHDVPLVNNGIVGTFHETTVVTDANGSVRFDVPNPQFEIGAPGGPSVQLVDGTTETVPIVGEMLSENVLQELGYLPGRYIVTLGDPDSSWTASGEARFFADVGEAFTTLGFS